VEDIGAGPRLDGGGDARLQIVGVDGLERDLGAQRLSRLRELASQLLVGLGDEVVPPDDVQRRALGEGRSTPGGDSALDAGRRRHRGRRELKEATPPDLA
jgi:hypothetical protein